MNAEKSDIGEHLGAARMAAHDVSGAATAFELALAAEPQYDMRGVRLPESVEAKGIKLWLEQAKKSGGKSGVKDAQKSLQELRTVSLGEAGGRDGVAEYRLLLAYGVVERAEATGEKTLPGGVELIETMKVPEMFPKASKAKLVRGAMLNCHAGTCELVFEGQGVGGR